MDIAKALSECIDYLEANQDIIKYSFMVDTTIVEIEKTFDTNGNISGYIHKTYKYTYK